MGMYKLTPVRSTLRFCSRFVLCFSMFTVVTALINEHCKTFKEHLLNDIGALCHYPPGLGPYAECKGLDFQRDLSEVATGVRFLCIFTDSTMIPASAFSHLGTIEFLIIHGYNLRRVESGAFSGLSNLKYLYVYFNDSNCSNIVLDKSVFAGLENLEVIHLKGINLSNIPNTTFEHLVSLVNFSLDGVCVKELGDVLCKIPNEMSRLKSLKVLTSGITSIRSAQKGCSSWPFAVLAGIRVLDLSLNPIKIIEAGSLAVFRNLSSFSLNFDGVWLGQIWESGVRNLSRILFSGSITEKYALKSKDMCQLVSKLNIHSLELTYVHLDSLSMEDFEALCGTELKELSIFYSNVKQLDLGFWRSIAGTQTMELYRIALTEAAFCDAANGTVWNVTTLNLMENHLTVVKTHQFVCTPLLEQLLLSKNAITTLEPEAFSGLYRLKILKLSTNKIKTLAADDFRSLRSLEVLLIDENVIEKIEEGIFRNQEKLRELSFGRLEYVYKLPLNLLFYGFPEDLERLSIDANFGTAFSFGSMGRPKKNLTFELSGLELNMDNYTPFLESIREFKLNTRLFFYKIDFLVPFFTNLELLEFTADPEQLFINYTGINRLHYLKRLKLINLNFSNHSNPGMTFWNLKRLRILVLYNCRLNFLTKMMFRDLQSLELLNLYSANPLTLKDGMFDALPVLSAVVLDRVDFQCDCDMGWFLEWAQSTRTQVINLQQQQCIWHYQKLNLLSTMEKLCQTDVQYLCYLGTVNIISLLLVSALCYRFAYWPCVVLILRVRGYMERRFGKFWWRRRQRHGLDDPEDDMKYDAFVSFSSRDEAWVLEELAPRLEEQGHPRLRLCLHSRDFEVGKGIVDNIAECIYSSRRTVCVLTRQYLRSDWCGLEMRIATHRLLEEEKHRLILIFLEHISLFELSNFHRLAKLVKSRTYLDWPQDKSERIHFWERLRRNIAEGEMDAP